MQLTISLSTLLLTLPGLTSAHMMLDHPSVWGRKSQGSNLETPLNRKSGKNWPHHGAKKDTSEVLELKAGQDEKLPIVCGEALGKPNPAKVCKAKSDIHMGGGCALSIAYKNVGKPSKDDFIVISVNHNCPQLGPFTHSFPMPENLPECEACTCAWTWVPDERSSADEMYMNTFNCKVTGGKKGKIQGGKKPIYFGVEGGVEGGKGGRPKYKTKFKNGAQKLKVQ
ncbi:hypothetical protein L211DRAFT_409728 [Terfezia boudieri ATCC MYA-4762]|uniref:Uncharacterized protein n=1 Tax=Terfezia boudieri ATCC MYA-4762 TaxID=1051890 RepID=A0A3N4LG85_9PEZI|nr:hypothetical protein L211DRAFT_409728 [Terfezia boudieri ATCC MYA-4762]